MSQLGRKATKTRKCGMIFLAFPPIEE